MPTRTIKLDKKNKQEYRQAKALNKQKKELQDAQADIHEKWMGRLLLIAFILAIGYLIKVTGLAMPLLYLMTFFLFIGQMFKGSKKKK